MLDSTRSTVDALAEGAGEDQKASITPVTRLAEVLTASPLAMVEGPDAATSATDPEMAAALARSLAELGDTQTGGGDDDASQAILKCSEFPSFKLAIQADTEVSVLFGGIIPNDLVVTLTNAHGAICFNV